MRCFRLSITNCYGFCNPARGSLSARAALQDSRPLPAKPRVDPTSAAAATELLPFLRLPRTTGIHKRAVKEHSEVWSSAFLPRGSIWGPHWPVHQLLAHTHWGCCHTAAPRLVGLSPPLQRESSHPHQTRNTCGFSTFRYRGFTCTNARIVQTVLTQTLTLHISFASF